MKTHACKSLFRWLILFCTTFTSLMWAATPSVAWGANPTSALVEETAPSMNGKWRTKGTFRLYANGILGVGGDAPILLAFKNNGSIIADRESWLVGWRNSGGRPRLAFNAKVIRRELGEPSSIRYSKRSLTVSGRSIKGNFDGTFRVQGVKVRLVWKFSGHR